MRTAGIDLAVQARDTAICTVEWRPGRAEVAFLDRGDNDTALAVLTDASVAAVGIDVPLGWPRAFSQAVAAHARHRRWPGADDDFSDDYAGLRLRNTDRRARALAAAHGIASLIPMSVSADRLGAPAMRAGWLLSRAGASVDVDRSGMTGTVVEAYPAGAAKMWGLELGRYKATGKTAAVAALQRCTDVLRQAAGWQIDLRTALRTEHDLDALLCAFVARAARTRSDDGRFLTIGPGPDDVDTAVEEGWIHLPRPGTLPALSSMPRPRGAPPRY